MKSIEVCIATMSSDKELLRKMNIQSDCIIGNQGEVNSVEQFIYNGHQVKWLSFNERGVGLNRNNALMRSTADIVMFADDDMVFEDDYRQTVLNIFNSNPKADVVVFNLINGKGKKTLSKHYSKKLGFGIARIAARREILSMNGIYFNQNFGGGCKFSNGEDTLFLAQCVKRGLKVLCVPEAVASLTNERPSTWFNGYTDKYFFDQGVLYAAANISFPCLRAIKRIFTISDGKIDKLHALKCVILGIKYFKNL